MPFLLPEDSTPLHAKRSERGRALSPCIRIYSGVDAVAAAVHCHAQGSETPDSKSPQTFRMQIVEIDVLDRLDPCGLKCCRAADDRQVCAAELSKRRKRASAKTSLADDEPDAVLGNERPRKALHTRGGGRADAYRRVACGMLRGSGNSLHVRSSVDHCVTRKIEARTSIAIEHRDLSGVADAEERSLQGHGVVDRKRSCLRFGNGCPEVVMRHITWPRR